MFVLVYCRGPHLDRKQEPSDKEIQTPGWCPTLSGDLNSSLPGSSGGEDNSNNAGSILVYLIIFILAHFFQVFLVYDAVSLFSCC